MLEMIRKMKAQVEAEKARSAWSRAIKADALEMLENMECNIDYIERPTTAKELEKILLNGAQSWTDYSWGGCGLIYDFDIAKHYCTPSELKRTKGGELRPNGREKWLYVQARALYQACNILKRIFRNLQKAEEI